MGNDIYVGSLSAGLAATISGVYVGAGQSEMALTDPPAAAGQQRDCADVLQDRSSGESVKKRCIVAPVAGSSVGGSPSQTLRG